MLQSVDGAQDTHAAHLMTAIEVGVIKEQRKLAGKVGPWRGCASLRLPYRTDLAKAKKTRKYYPFCSVYFTLSELEALAQFYASGSSDSQADPKEVSK
jgi:hypothetical protein